MISTKGQWILFVLSLPPPPGSFVRKRNFPFSLQFLAVIFPVTLYSTSISKLIENSTNKIIIFFSGEMRKNNNSNIRYWHNYICSSSELLVIMQIKIIAQFVFASWINAFCWVPGGELVSSGSLDCFLSRDGERELWFEVLAKIQGKELLAWIYFLITFQWQPNMEL